MKTKTLFEQTEVPVATAETAVSPDAKPPGKRQSITKPAKKNDVVPFEPRPTNLMVVFANAASDPKCDTQKMRELKEMMTELKREEAEVAFTEAYIELRA